MNQNHNRKATVAIQSLLRPELTQVCANKDYEEFADTLDKIESLFKTLDLETEIIKIISEENVHLNIKELSRLSQQTITAFKTEALRSLLGNLSFRVFSTQIACSDLLAKFCGALSIEGIKGVSKSVLERNSKMLKSESLILLHQHITGLVCDSKGASDCGLACAIEIKDQFVDSTCIEANVHYPVDWLLLKDLCSTLLFATALIRKKKVLCRMPQEPESFHSNLNQLCIKMTNTRRKKNAKKTRKGIFRELKKFTRVVAAHASRHSKKLEGSWEGTDWSVAQKDLVRNRIKHMLGLLDSIVYQANERIIGERLIASKDKVLSIYDLELEVLVRGKAGKEVEYGNKFFLSESVHGYVFDFNLIKGNLDDRDLLKESLQKMEEGKLPQASSICGDRGFNGGTATEVLKRHKMKDNTCPRSVEVLQEKLKDKGFTSQQKRRASTEARIAILKNKFNLGALRSKGFINRQQSCSYAVLTHNLWKLAKILQGQEKELQVA